MASSTPEQPVHLATHGQHVRCQTRPVALHTRRTRYPALVTCEGCQQRFTERERGAINDLKLNEATDF
jgi:hypothetical protein